MKNKRILYLECYSGISGDMTVGALLDAGADAQVLTNALDSLHVDGYHVTIGRTKKCGIDACDFDVLLDDQPEYDEGHMHDHGHDHESGHDHDYDHDHESGQDHHHDHESGQDHHHDHDHEGGQDHIHDHDHESSHDHHHDHEHDHEGGQDHIHDHDHESGHDHHHDHEHDHEGGHDHDHDHESGQDHIHAHVHEEHTHDHGHEHSHGHHHTHEHRNISDVFAVIDKLDAAEHVKAMARKMFQIVARAESRAHGIPVEEVHFHEVGAIDSIVDIISVAVCLDNLKVDEVVVSELYEGTGHARCQHGIIPVPVPATANICMNNQLKLHMTDNQGEMVTPTGAAIAAALRTMDKLPESYQVVRIGLGAGKKDFARANILRAMILETGEGKENAPQVQVSDTLWALESNIDDCTGETLGYTMEKLLAAGARDVYFIPVYMKKNRPAYMLNVLCTEVMIPAMEEIIFRQTTTIGIRKYPVIRAILERTKCTVETGYGPVEVKCCTHGNQTYIYPEYDSVKALCDEKDLVYNEVYHEAVTAARKKQAAE